MSENVEKDTNVHDTEKIFYFESRVCGMSWSLIMSERGLYKKKYTRSINHIYSLVVELGVQSKLVRGSIPCLQVKKRIVCSPMTGEGAQQT